MLCQAICVLKCRFTPSRSDSFPLVTCVSFSGLDGVKSGPLPPGTGIDRALSDG